LEGIAEPGAICVSAAAWDHIGNKLPLGFDDLGDQQVKNIAQAIRVYRVQTVLLPSTAGFERRSSAATAICRCPSRSEARPFRVEGCLQHLENAKNLANVG
jgi:adenylate cyclase